MVLPYNSYYFFYFYYYRCWIIKVLLKIVYKSPWNHVHHLIICLWVSSWTFDVIFYDFFISQYLSFWKCLLIDYSIATHFFVNFSSLFLASNGKIPYKLTKDSKREESMCKRWEEYLNNLNKNALNNAKNVLMVKILAVEDMMLPWPLPVAAPLLLMLPEDPVILITMA